MRELLIQVPKANGEAVYGAARANGGVNLIRFETTGGMETLIAYVPNAKVEALIGQIQDIPDLHVTLKPRGSIPLRSPASDAHKQAVEIDPRSPIEVFLGGLQSVGSWKGFLGYAVTAGTVVWIGLFTNTSYLLVAAMLIAPFAGPAMNAAIGTARGDPDLLTKSLLRYFAAIGTSVIAAAALSLALVQEAATSQMIDISQVSAVSVLLPLAAGVAGALNLVQSERSSLVSGAAVGLLVAASLAPPAGLIGMASAIGRWDLVKSGLFVLLLQLVGINLSGSIIFRLYGLSPEGARYDRGKKWVCRFSMAATALFLGGLLLWQFLTQTDLQRSSLAQRAAVEVQKVVKQSDLVSLVETSVRFTRPSTEDQDTLLGIVYVQREPGSNLSSEEIRSRLTKDVQMHLLQQGFQVTPVIDVNVLEKPSGLK